MPKRYTGLPDDLDITGITIHIGDMVLYYLLDTEILMVQFQEQIFNYSNHSMLNI